MYAINLQKRLKIQESEMESRDRKTVRHLVIGKKRERHRLG